MAINPNSLNHGNLKKLRRQQAAFARLCARLPEDIRAWTFSQRCEYMALAKAVNLIDNKRQQIGRAGSTGPQGIQGPVGPVFHVTRFGALGDNITDDTTAIQNCINAMVLYRAVESDK